MFGTRVQKLAALGFSVALALAVLVVLFWMAGSAGASPPAQGPETPLLINYQGYLTYDSGQPITATLNMTFTIYSAATNGTNLWQEASKPVSVTNGLFNTVLGSQEALSTAVFTSTELWLGVQVGGDAEMTPRQRLVSAPYAIGARDADTLDGLHASDLGDITAVHTGTGLTGGGESGAVTLAADTTYLQRRVISSCTSAQAIRLINQDGTVTCQDVSGSTGDITAVYAGDGLTGGGTSGEVTVTLDVTYTDGRYWSLTGNGGTQYGTNFVGTTDAVSLTLAVDGEAALRLEPHATSPNVIGGYSGNSVTAGVYGATIGGGGSSGYTNRVTGTYGTVGGGQNNEASNSYATVGGGYGNEASGDAATVPGGYFNEATSNYTTISGGRDNEATSNSATVGGGYGNEASGGEAATVGGGQYNEASGASATVGGGYDNEASGGEAATVGGGQYNEASGASATVGGGRENTASRDYATVGGGQNNKAITGTHATVGGGYYNTASGAYATVGGGENNTASGIRATVPGGSYNTADGDYSFAAGRRAKANHNGAFVWADSTGADINSPANNTFIARANGGFWFGQSTINFTPTLSATAFISTSTGACLDTNGTWYDTSDRNAKENFVPVDGQEVLARLAEMPITTWNFKADDPSIHHIGPVAQDFYAAFGLGRDDTHLSALDTSGVALAAIQELYQRNQELEAENAAQQQKIDNLDARLAALEALMAGKEGR